MFNPQKQLSSSVFTNPIFMRNKSLGVDACEILANAIQAVDSYQCVLNSLQLKDNVLQVGRMNFPLDQCQRIFLIGFGKAAVPMAEAVIDKMGEKIHSASVITKDAKFLSDIGYHEKLTIYLGGHPVPSEASITSTHAILSHLPPLNPDDLVLVLISGGGSALLTDPVPGVTLYDLQHLTDLLLNCGADISEMNTLRKHLDQVKGGRLAERLQPASVISLILSDVIGDRLDMIASGPTVPDPTTFQDALLILARYDIRQKVTQGVLQALENGRDGLIPETVKPDLFPLEKVHHHLVGSNFIAASAAQAHACTIGYNAKIISAALTGRTDHLVEFLGGILNTTMAYDQPEAKPACLIFGGEPTVNVLGEGLGGRNMDLALRMVPWLAGKPGTLFISFATDGEDGPTDAAGAVADALVLTEGQEKYNLNIDAYISNNDSYHYFEQVGGLIKTGSTGTNVNDLVFLFIKGKSKHDLGMK